MLQYSPLPTDLPIVPVNRTYVRWTGSVTASTFRSSSSATTSKVERLESPSEGAETTVSKAVVVRPLCNCQVDRVKTESNLIHPVTFRRNKEQLLSESSKVRW
jgi:hypothetical protein